MLKPCWSHRVQWNNAPMTGITYFISGHEARVLPLCASSWIVVTLSSDLNVHLIRSQVEKHLLCFNVAIFTVIPAGVTYESLCWNERKAMKKGWQGCSLTILSRHLSLCWISKIIISSLIVKTKTNIEQKAQLYIFSTKVFKSWKTQT